MSLSEIELSFLPWFPLIICIFCIFDDELDWVIYVEKINDKAKLRVNVDKKEVKQLGLKICKQVVALQISNTVKFSQLNLKDKFWLGLDLNQDLFKN